MAACCDCEVCACCANGATPCCSEGVVDGLFAVGTAAAGVTAAVRTEWLASDMAGVTKPLVAGDVITFDGVVGAGAAGRRRGGGVDIRGPFVPDAGELNCSILLFTSDSEDNAGSFDDGDGARDGCADEFIADGEGVRLDGGALSRHSMSDSSPGVDRLPINVRCKFTRLFWVRSDDCCGEAPSSGIAASCDDEAPFLFQRRAALSLRDLTVELGSDKRSKSSSTSLGGLWTIC